METGCLTPFVIFFKSLTKGLEIIINNKYFRKFQQRQKVDVTSTK